MSAATGNILTNPPYFFEKLNPPTFVIIIYMAPIHIWPTTSRSASNFCGPRKCTQHGPRASHMTTAKAHGRAHAFAGQLCLLHRIAITLLTFLNLQKKKNPTDLSAISCITCQSSFSTICAYLFSHSNSRLLPD